MNGDSSCCSISNDNNSLPNQDKYGSDLLTFNQVDCKSLQNNVVFLTKIKT